MGCSPTSQDKGRRGRVPRVQDPHLSKGHAWEVPQDAGPASWHRVHVDGSLECNHLHLSTAHVWKGPQGAVCVSHSHIIMSPSGKTTLIKALTGEATMQLCDHLFTTLGVMAHVGLLPFVCPSCTCLSVTAATQPDPVVHHAGGRGGYPCFCVDWSP